MVYSRSKTDFLPPCLPIKGSAGITYCYQNKALARNKWQQTPVSIPQQCPPHSEYKMLRFCKYFI
jgi:hypothetical protein